MKQSKYLSDDVTLAQLRDEADTFIGAISSSFWEEHGISDDEAVEGLLALGCSTGRISYGNEKRIRAEIQAEKDAEAERSRKAREEYLARHPEPAFMSELMESMAMNTNYMQRHFVKSILGYDPYEEAEKRKTAVRGWWAANGVTL